MIKLQTTVDISPSKRKISFDDKIMVLGSCFSDNIGQKLLQSGFDVSANPFGTLYNPRSIADSIMRMQQRSLFNIEDCIGMGSGSDLICSFSHHTSFARKTAEEFIANANAKLIQAADFLEQCDILIITWGTAWCYRHVASGKIVSNCLKRDAREFSRERMSTGDITGLYTSLLQSLPPRTKAIFTVSPIRHLKDGAHGNQTSKSTLLLSADSLIEKLPGTEYFPSYEIVMDELRDYRFYADDMTHPSQLAVDYIWERFCDTYMTPGTKETARLNIKKYKSTLHRAMH